MAETWNATFNTSPTGSDLVGNMDDFIRATRQATKERLAVEHLFDYDANTHQGLLRQGAARVWFSDTEPAAPTPSASEADNAGTIGRVWVVTSSSVPTGEIKVYDGSAWVTVNGDDSYLNRTKGSGVAYNDVEVTGFYDMTADTTGGPVAAAATFLIVDGIDASNTLQIAVVSSTSEIYYRMQASGVWQNWKTFGRTVSAGSYSIGSKSSTPVLLSTSYAAKASHKTAKTGTYTVKITVVGTQSDSDTYTLYGRIYKNGSEVGTERTLSVTTGISSQTANWSENIAIVPGDVLALYMKVSAARANTTQYGTLDLLCAEEGWA